MKVTNYNALKKLMEVYRPRTRSYISCKEKELITEILQIEKMDLLELQNLRDFVVLFLSQNCKSPIKERENTEIMSAIVHVIDIRTVKLGGNI